MLGLRQGGGGRIATSASFVGLPALTVPAVFVIPGEARNDIPEVSVIAGRPSGPTWQSVLLIHIQILFEISISQSGSRVVP